ncbi:transcription factor MYBS3 isoform X2 [Lathyrus oleraceus]|uniref:MYB transcription factor n=1 Tax=Pisum sativum TaxID=3888 RepID=A0A9D4XHA3_PEA|nr:transcription factor MYBS3-like isoform X2 [Pisum sativum]KAI5418885.1 hypothetical protein KIW84_043197 [Pisum sativum]
MSHIEMIDLTNSSDSTITPSQITTLPQLGMHSGSSVARVLPPLPKPNTFSFFNGSRLRVPWSQQEHDLFVMGLTEYGKGKWSKIAKHYVCNKTPQQVQCYARNFFKYLPASYVDRFKRKKLSSNTNNFVSRKNKETLDLFPMKDYREEPSIFMNVPRVSASNGEVDLELRLSLYK